MQLCVRSERYLQLLLCVCVPAAPGLLPPPHALLQASQRSLLTAPQLPHTRPLLLAGVLQAADLQGGQVSAALASLR